MKKPKYLKWIVEEEGINFEDYKQSEKLKCYRLSYSKDDTILDDWALHIRRHYERDSDVKESAASHNQSVEEYLNVYDVPQKEERPLGPVARSTDLAEILVADIFEFIYKFKVPRVKLMERFGKNNSQLGTDIIAYKFDKGLKEPNEKDVCIAIEVKALLNGKTPGEAAKTIEEAVKDSKLDEYRFGITIDASRKRCKRFGMKSRAQELARFQVETEHPYRMVYIGAAVTSLSNIEENVIVGAKGEDLLFKTNQYALYIHGTDLMALAHEIYERCTK